MKWEQHEEQLVLTNYLKHSAEKFSDLKPKSVSTTQKRRIKMEVWYFPVSDKMSIETDS